MMVNVLRCLAGAIVKRSWREFLDGVPPVRWSIGVCEDFIDSWKKAQANEAKRRRELQALANAPPETVSADAATICDEVVPLGTPQAHREELAAYLQMVPIYARSAVNAQNDGKGRKLSVDLPLEKSSDVKVLLPGNIAYAKKSKFIQPCEEVISGCRTELGAKRTFLVKLKKGGYPGRIAVTIQPGDKTFFGTNWKKRDPSWFPARIKAAATALRNCGCAGAFEIAHEDGSLKITEL